jgi:hypothetical protein
MSYVAAECFCAVALESIEIEELARKGCCEKVFILSGISFEDAQNVEV